MSWREKEFPKDFGSQVSQELTFDTEQKRAIKRLILDSEATGIEYGFALNGTRGSPLLGSPQKNPELEEESLPLEGGELGSFHTHPDDERIAISPVDLAASYQQAESIACIGGTNELKIQVMKCYEIPRKGTKESEEFEELEQAILRYAVEGEVEEKRRLELKYWDIYDKIMKHLPAYVFELTEDVHPQVSEQQFIPGTEIPVEWNPHHAFAQQRMFMPTELFLKLSGPPMGGFSLTSLKTIKDGIAKGNPMTNLELEVDVDRMKVTNHEGRHRAYWAYKKGIKYVPVTIIHRKRYEFPDGGKYLRDTEVTQQIDPYKLKPESKVTAWDYAVKDWIYDPDSVGFHPQGTIDEIREGIIESNLAKGLNWIIVVNHIPQLQVPTDKAIEYANYYESEIRKSFEEAIEPEIQEEMAKIRFKNLLDGKDYSLKEMVNYGKIEFRGALVDEDQRKQSLKKCIFRLTQLEENPHNLMRSLGNKDNEKWYLYLIRKQSKELLDLNCITKEIYDEIIGLSDKIENKLKAGENPYLETEQILALCKSQIPSQIVDVYGQPHGWKPSDWDELFKEVSDRIKAFNEDPYR